MIKHMSQKDPKQMGIKITAELKENYSINHRICITKQCLNDDGLHGRCPAIKPLIMTKNKKNNITLPTSTSAGPVKCGIVLWTDESKFNTFSSDGMQYI